MPTSTKTHILVLQPSIVLMQNSYLRFYFYISFSTFLFTGQKDKAPPAPKEEFKCPVGYGNGNFADPVTCRRFYQVISFLPSFVAYFTLAYLISFVCLLRSATPSEYLQWSGQLTLTPKRSCALYNIEGYLVSTLLE